MVTIPGAVGAFRRQAIAGVGGVPGDTLAEDTDLTISIVEAGWRVRYAAQARAWTEAPSTVRQLWTQRHRWTYGTMQSLWKHRRTLATPAGRWTLAWIGLPYLFVMACVLPLISPAADVYVLVEVGIAPWRAAAAWGGFVLVQGTLALAAFALDRERLRYLWTLPLQQLFYRQLMYLVVLHSMATAVTGGRQRWHKLARIGVDLPDL
jgi:cellulose synthase/poly-beta-1,6-N-acetylglucosamine synthase-like glycosyltransferase